MCHRFQLQDSRHDGVSGEVSLEEFLVHGEILDRGAFHLGRETGDAIDEEEGVAVGEDFEDVLDIENRFGFGKFDRRNHRAHRGVVFLESLSGFGIWTVAGFDGDDVSVEFFPGKHKIADEVEGLVSRKFVVESHRLLGHDFVAPDDDGIFERASFDEAFVQKWFDVLVEGKGSGWSDLFFVDL